MDMRDRVVLVLTSTAVAAGTVAGFAQSIALGFAALAVQLWIVVAFIAFSEDPPETTDDEGRDAT